MERYVYLITPLVAYVITQTTKMVVSLRKDGVQMRDAWSSGGMPSVHTATMVSLVTIIGLRDGLHSPLFSIVFVLTCIVAYDAVGVRRTAGETAEAVISLQKQVKERRHILVHAALGHAPSQVAVGAAIGIFVGVILANLL